MIPYRFIDAEKAGSAIALLSRFLGVAWAGYYARHTLGPSRRAQADQTVTAVLMDSYTRSRQTYGVPRLHAALRDASCRVNRKWVSRLLRTGGCAG